MGPFHYSEPDDLHELIESKIGTFPFFNFWGPLADIRSSQWIVDCSILEYQLNKPNLQLVYLPHLDYNLQRLGPKHPDIAKDLQAIDEQAGRLIDFYRSQGVDIMVVSEYGITQVDHSIAVNRILREAGLLRVRKSLTWELLDPGASRAFAVADHQCAHVYVKNSTDLNKVRQLLEKIDGIEHVLDHQQQKTIGINHSRSGSFVLIAESNCWFNYYYWMDDNKAPDFARTVDIHRKPGYDPVELFIDPNLRFPSLKIAKRLLQKKMGQRTLMDVIPIAPELVKGSHGRVTDLLEDGPLLIASNKQLASHLCDQKVFPMQKIKSLICQHFY